MSSLHTLFREFDGRCCYCGCGTWILGKQPLARVRARFGIVSGVPGSAKALSYRRATRDHLQRVADGGGNARANLALACSWCNIARGEATPEQHRENIARAIALGLHPNHPPLAALSKPEMRRARKAIGLSFFSCESVAASEACHVG